MRAKGITAFNRVLERLGSKKRLAEPQTETKPPGGDLSEEASTDSQSVIEERYSLEGLREGAMGDVLIVRDQQTGDRYAVKVPKAETGPFADDALQRFALQARAWIGLGFHPHLVAALFYRVIERRPYLFLEYVNGISLAEEFATRKTIFIPERLVWAAQVAQAMAHAHSCRMPDGRVGVLHRDLKPGNIFLTAGRRVKVSDFGLARYLDGTSRITDQGVILGTPAYMPPEQLESGGAVDRRTDLYAFGAILYEMVTGRPPFVAKSQVDLCRIILKAPLVPVKEIAPDASAELDMVIGKCLDKKPSNRFASFDEVLTALEAVPEWRWAQSRDGVPKARALSFNQWKQETFVGKKVVLAVRLHAARLRASRYAQNILRNLRRELHNLIQLETGRHFGACNEMEDGTFLLTFPTPSRAHLATSALSKQVSRRNREVPPHRQFYLKIGVDTGETRVDESGFPFGAAVEAARFLCEFGEDSGPVDPDPANGEMTNHVYLYEDALKTLANSWEGPSMRVRQRDGLSPGQTPICEFFLD